MGREIRRVPANWEHPKETNMSYRTRTLEESYKPMYNRCIEKAWADWLEDFNKWKLSEHQERLDEYDDGTILPIDQPYRAYCDWEGGPPDLGCYRPSWTEEEMTWWQVYETVSEGTPVTPPFETQQELVDYLVANGDFWDQKRRKEGRAMGMPCSPWPREQAEEFVRGPGWAPSMVVSNGQVMSGVEFVTREEPAE